MQTTHVFHADHRPFTNDFPSTDLMIDSRECECECKRECERKAKAMIQ